jgi:EAL domain-containing protein (putative c-di-GMP-specific phosphodiesterase class I)
VSSPIDIAGERIAVGSNVGIAAAAHFSDADALRVLAGAEIAIQRANALGSRRVIVYELAARNDPTRFAQLFADMLPAISAGQFVAYYQPVVSLPDLEVRSAEALVRWVHPGHGVILPSEFLAEAEVSGLIRDIDANVRQAACAACATWPSNLKVAVNVSAADLDSPAFVDSVAAVLTTANLAPGRLMLEVTETAMSQDWPRARRRLAALKEMGVRLAVDDFGSGHMFLDRLSVGIFDVLKLDRSLITMADDSWGRHRALLSSVTAMATALDLEVMAEGVETPEHLERVIEAGCSFAQGYLFGAPLPPADFAKVATSSAQPA